jgi:putative molybdopterin biosynthesis protein
MLLDQELARLGIPTDSVHRYERVLPGHLAVAEAIGAGLVDVGVGVRAAAIAAELDFLPLDEEHYDLVVPNHFLDLPSVSGLLDILRRPGLRDQVESLGGYDGATMGEATSVTPA